MNSLIEREKCTRCGEPAIFIVNNDVKPVRLCKGCLATFDKLFNEHTAGSPDNSLASLGRATVKVIHDMD